MIYGAFALFLVADHDVLAIKVDHAELFGFSVRHGGVAIIQQRVPARQHMLAQEPRTRHAVGRCLYYLEFDDDGVAHTRDIT